MVSILGRINGNARKRAALTKKFNVKRSDSLGGLFGRQGWREEERFVYEMIPCEMENIRGAFPEST
jgi:hypothetical protein